MTPVTAVLEEHCWKLGDKTEKDSHEWEAVCTLLKQSGSRKNQTDGS